MPLYVCVDRRASKDMASKDSDHVFVALADDWQEERSVVLPLDEATSHQALAMALDCCGRRKPRGHYGKQRRAAAATFES